MLMEIEGILDVRGSFLQNEPNERGHDASGMK